MAFPRPFLTEIDHGLAAYGGDLQVLVTLRDPAPPTERVRGSFDEVFHDFANVALWGALAGHAFPPPSSSMQLVEAALLVSRSELLWTFSASAVDPGCLLVIENLVHGLHSEVASVDRLRLGGRLVSGLNAVPPELPVDYEPYPFEVEYNMESAQVLVDVTFATRQDVTALSAFRAAWRGWEGIAVGGGFADATYLPGRANLALEDELTVTTTGIGAAYDDVSIADAGFYCLVNMLETLHHRGVSIESVVIE